MTLPKLTCSACGERIRESSLDRGVYHSFNYCCSPECGQWWGGYACDRDEGEPRMVLWARNRRSINAAIDARAHNQATCEHRWVKGSGTVAAFRALGAAEYFDRLECKNCGATKKGERRA